MSKRIAIIAGAGPGTGAAVASRFSRSYPVVLLARNPKNLDPTVASIKEAGGSAIGLSADLSSAESVTAAVKGIKEHFGEDVTAAAAIFNASGGFVRKPFLETTDEEWTRGYSGSINAAVHFSRAVLPLLESDTSASTSTSGKPQHPPTLIFTGATAAMKAGANFSLFASSKWAQRALSQSLAKEYGPKGVHVSHVIIDGVINTPATEAWGLDEAKKIGVGDIAEGYWYLHSQPKTGWTWEMDLRPSVETW